MRGRIDKVIVSCQQGQVMADTEPRKHSINGPDLNACPAASVAQLRGIDMVLPVRAEKRQRGKEDRKFKRPFSGTVNLSAYRRIVNRHLIGALA
jgi:hypothetical protein